MFIRLKICLTAVVLPFNEITDGEFLTARNDYFKLFQNVLTSLRSLVVFYCIRFARLCNIEREITGHRNLTINKKAASKTETARWYYIPILSRYGIAARILSHSQLLRGLRSCFLMTNEERTPRL